MCTQISFALADASRKLRQAWGEQDKNIGGSSLIGLKRVFNHVFF